MTILKHDIQELFQMERSRRFDAIFATTNLSALFKKTLSGAPRERYALFDYGLTVQIKKEPIHLDWLR